LRLFKAAQRIRCETGRCLSDQLQLVHFFEKRPHVALARRESQALFSRIPQFVDDPMAYVEALLAH